MNLKLMFFVLILALTSCTTPSYSPSDVHYFGLISVSVTNLEGNSGGSGTIVKTTPTYSQILTNKHVCELVKKGGGLVNTEFGEKLLIQMLVESEEHDLCLVTVAKDLHYAARLANEAPRFLDESIVSGHPGLYPLIVSRGHFSGKIIADVVIDQRACTEEEKNDPKLSFVCAFVGFIPIVHRYEAQVVSNLIKPGSSGSGVYNEFGELSGVVFAGSEGLSYGLIVPYEFVANFLNVESKTLPDQAPPAELDLQKLLSPSAGFCSL